MEWVVTALRHQEGRRIWSVGNGLYFGWFESWTSSSRLCMLN